MQSKYKFKLHNLWVSLDRYEIMTNTVILYHIEAVSCVHIKYLTVKGLSVLTQIDVKSFYI